MTGFDLSVLQIKTKIVSCRTADSKPVKQEVNGTVILPPLVFPAAGKSRAYPRGEHPKVAPLEHALGQCDQIGRNFAVEATFLLSQFSPKQAVSTHGLSQGFKSILM